MMCKKPSWRGRCPSSRTKGQYTPKHRKRLSAHYSGKDDIKVKRRSCAAPSDLLFLVTAYMLAPNWYPREAFLSHIMFFSFVGKKLFPQQEKN
jgi:hypothetical protein